MTLLLALGGNARAQSGDVVKPYFQVIVDTSGSMAASDITNSCGQPVTRLNAAKCVLADLINAYGDVAFGLSRFAMKCIVTGTYGDVYTVDCTSRTASSVTADRGKTLVPLGEDNQTALLGYLDFAPTYPSTAAQSCPGTASPAEILINEVGYGLTPLAGSLRSAQRYYQGNDPDFPGSPIASDPYLSCPRPYSVILLTDGDETCADGTAGDPAVNLAAAVSAATDLRATSVPGVPGTIDIRTYVIGFGISPGDSDIEALANAGGTDAPGTYRGFYASDETSLALAFAQIIEDSQLIEVCDGIDNDCDGLIDEGFVKYCDKEHGITTLSLCTNPGDPCDGEDDNCFAGVTDETTNACGTCGPVPTEICNALDDDCDGFIDEGGVCGGCAPEPEICDGKDNDCDGRFDEEISRPCGSDVGVCTPGTQVCIEQPSEAPTGTWGPCSGTPPSGETCNGLDDDCDGLVDGNAEACYEFGTGCTIGVGCDGICQVGTRVCTLGVWGDCVGDVGPATEICNGIDDDCDGAIDEGDPGGGIPCGSSCGVGVTQCVMGEIVCTGGGGGEPEVCNGFDDDCDGLVDEDIPPGGPCMEDTLCVPGELQCIGGSMQCVGGVPPETEACDCEDNDCDGEVDEGSVCGAGATCLSGPYCLCALPCAEDEFPCPLGNKCVDYSDGNRYCVPDPCYGVTCDPTEAGDPTTCVDGECVPLCDTVSCTAPFVCNPADGRCVEDNCNGFPERCTADQFCVDGDCVDNPCLGVECDPAQFCRDGDCVASCAGVICPGGQRCDSGSCVDDPCAGTDCADDELCVPTTGECTRDHCPGVFCPSGTVCDPATGDCDEDPCLEVVCPAGQECIGGNCYNPGDLTRPDAGADDHTYVTAGGDGCLCSTSGGAPGGGGWLVAALVALALWPHRRRRRRRGGEEVR